jgi:hypothetical protein
MRIVAADDKFVRARVLAIVAPSDGHDRMLRFTNVKVKHIPEINIPSFILVTWAERFEPKGSGTRLSLDRVTCQTDSCCRGRIVREWKYMERMSISSYICSCVFMSYGRANELFSYDYVIGKKPMSYNSDY